MSKYLTKKNIIIACSLIAVIVLIIVLAVACSKEKQIGPQPVYEEIIVDGLKFDDAIILEENGLYTYNLKIKNTNKKDFKLKYFIFKLYDKDNKEITSLIGYIGDVIKSGKETTVTSNVDIDIRNAKKFEIIINK